MGDEMKKIAYSLFIFGGLCFQIATILLWVDDG